MFKSLFSHRTILLLLLGVVVIKLFSFYPHWVESLYTGGFYPFISRVLRFFFGWVPFSIGDIVYLAAGVWLAAKIIKTILLIRRKRFRAALTWRLAEKYTRIGLTIYVVFALFWGLNYYREGISVQTGLSLETYSSADLLSLTGILKDRLVASAQKIDSVQRLRYNKNSKLFIDGVSAYNNGSTLFPFLQYSRPSMKPSLFTPIGNWFGFTGYYNPFSGEAQLKTTVPVFLKPFIITHEMAHQLGYAKENEANFVAYLICKNATDKNFVYSAYFEIFSDAVGECRLRFQKSTIDSLVKDLPPRVRWDSADLRKYLLSERNFVEPVMSGAYDKYLKLNNQPNGKATYDEVITYVMAYMKKFGKGAI